MPNQIGACGMHDYTTDQVFEVLSKAAKVADILELEDITYIRSRMGERLACWSDFATDGEKPELLDYNFHWHSDRRNPARFRVVIGRDRAAMSGLVRVHMPMATKDGRDMPVNVLLPLLPSALVLHKDAAFYLQLTAVPQQVSFVPDRAAYASSEPAGYGLPPEHFVPAGTFLEEGEHFDEQTNEALIGGRIARIDRCVNAYTGLEYLHLLVRSLGVEYDVLADPLDMEGEPCEGGWMHGAFFLTGMAYPRETGEDYLEMESFPGDMLSARLRELEPGQPESRSFSHIYPTVPRRYHRARYLNTETVSDPDEPMEASGEGDTATIRFILRPGAFPDEEATDLTSIMGYIGATLQGSGQYLDRMQIELVNDPDGEPDWEMLSDERFRITLAVDSVKDYCQTIYQLGYLFTHCVLAYRQFRNAVPWMEETICEMMSIWMLSRFAYNWAELPLGSSDPDYPEAIRSYVSEYLTDQEWTDAPGTCRTREELLALNDHAADRSDERVGTVIRLYYLTDGAALEGLLDMVRYAQQDGSVLTRAWSHTYPGNLAVRYLCSIQDRAFGEGS